MDKPVVLITGASSGIGEMTAKTLGASGFRVILAARRVARLEQIADQIRGAGGQAVPLQLDLSRLEEIEKAVAGIKKEFGPIQILVNNAGSARHLWLDELAPGPDIQLQLQVNLIGMIQLTRAVLPDMLSAGAGQIIHVSSIASWVGIPTYSIYNASKFGSRGFFEGLRRELRGTGVFVSEIFPGAVDTDFGQDPQVAWKTTTITPGFMLLTPQDVADKIHDLIRTKQARSVLPGIMRPAIWANALFPGFVSWVLSKFFYVKDGKRYSWRESRE